MFATQVLASPVAAEKILQVLSACRLARTVCDYARQFIKTVAEVTHSEHAIWLSGPPDSLALIAATENAVILTNWLGAVPHVPLLVNDWNACDAIHSVVATPVMFRSTAHGILAVANSNKPYTPDDLWLLEEIGRGALLDYERLARTDARSLVTEQQSIAELSHELRQPLGILEACAFLLDLALPPDETRARELLAEMRRQMDRASGILDAGVKPYRSRVPRPDVTDPDDSESLALTQSAISMVT
jgi:signal transduction histidine kinase